MRSVRTMLSWILLAVMLVSLPGGTTGHFVCTRGMADAGPACPLCHGRASAEQPGDGIGNGCCKFVGGQSGMDARLTAAPVEPPVLGQTHLFPADASLSLLVATDRDLIARAGQRSAPRTFTSDYRSSFLRL